MWKNFIESRKGEIRPDFPLSTLAHITEGYSAGSIKRTVDKVMSDFRVKNIQNRPLTLQEFIGPISGQDIILLQMEKDYAIDNETENTKEHFIDF